MFSKKSILALLLCGAMTVSMAGCGGAGKTASVADAASTGTAAKAGTPKYIMKIGHSQPEGNPRYTSVEAFKKEVEEKSNGGISVEIYPAGQLGTEKEMLESVKMNTLQGMRGGQFDMLPKLLIFTLPFLCENNKQVDALTSSDFALKVCEGSQKDNILILGLGNAGGFRQFTNNKHAIKSPSDLKGLKIRTPGMDTIDGALKAMGASTVSVPYSDLYMSLKTGVADGQENPLVNVSSLKLFEVQKYITIVNYMFHPDPFYVNMQWFNALPADYQSIIKTATSNMMILNNDSIAKQEAEALKVIEKNADVYTPTAEELQQFKDATKVVYDNYVKEGKITKEELATMQDIVAKAK
nr:TRAP transporter substrate-binding protein [uncultured Caproiciproducens sp.]